MQLTMVGPRFPLLRTSGSAGKLIMIAVIPTDGVARLGGGEGVAGSGVREDPEAAHPFKTGAKDPAE